MSFRNFIMAGLSAATVLLVLALGLWVLDSVSGDASAGADGPIMLTSMEGGAPSVGDSSTTTTSLLDHSAREVLGARTVTRGDWSEHATPHAAGSQPPASHSEPAFRSEPESHAAGEAQHPESEAGDHTEPAQAPHSEAPSTSHETMTAPSSGGSSGGSVSGSSSHSGGDSGHSGSDTGGGMSGGGSHR